MTNVEQTAQTLKQSIENTISGQHPGGCQEWIQLINGLGNPTNEKDRVLIEGLNNLAQAFTNTMNGKGAGDLTMWHQQLVQTIANADYLAKS